MDSQTALDTYLDFLDTSSATEKEALPTPHIDTVLQQFRHRAVTDSSSDLHPHRPHLHPAPPTTHPSGYELRLKQLEGQLSDLLQRSKGSRKQAKPTTTKHRSYNSSESDQSDSDPVRPGCARQSTKTSWTSLAAERTGPQQFTAKSTSQRRQRTCTKVSRTKKPKGTPLSGSHGNIAAHDRSVSHRSDVNRGANQAGSSPSPSEHPRGISSPSADMKKKTKLLMETQRGRSQERRRDDTSVQVLTKELDVEREQRWKAEQATGRLVEHVRGLQSQLTEAQRRHELAVVRAAQLEREVGEEQGGVQGLQSQVQELQDALSSSRGEVEQLRQCGEEQRKALRTLEESYTRRDAEQIQERARASAQLRESEKASSGHQREAELLRKTARQLKQQLQHLQELLATREREHLRERERCKPLDGREVQNVVAREVEKERAKMEGVVDQHKQRVAEQQKAYQNLEDEFRMALRIEAERYHELQRTYQEVAGEVEACRQTAISAVRKEQRATGMVAELTAMVKEQKGRITELSRGKQEAIGQLKERVSDLETDLATKHKLEVKVQALQEENSRLLAQLAAQESVSEGLREERKLWGKELAYQGASLAQERGRMEAQLEALTQEVKDLREQTHRKRDTLRIKEKLMDDQNKSIQELRQAAAAKEYELQSAQLEWQQRQQLLQLHLEQEEAAGLDLQEQLSALVERKEQLKEELASSREEVDQWKSRFSKLKGQWDEKVVVIGSLEQDLSRVQQSFSEREGRLAEEKERAVERARAAEERLKSCDDAFREQLEGKQRSHDSHVTQLMKQKNQEVEQANQKVLTVETEMRELLAEMAREKRNMETKFEKLSKAFQELHQEIT